MLEVLRNTGLDNVVEAAGPPWRDPSHFPPTSFILSGEGKADSGKRNLPTVS